VVNCSVVKKVEAEMEEWFKVRRVNLDTAKAFKAIKSLNETITRLFGINLIEEYLIKTAEVNGFRYYASATLIGHFAGPKAELNRVSGLRLSRGCRRLKSGGSSVECIQRVLESEVCRSFYHYVPTADTACPYLYNQADFEEKFILL